MPKINFKRWAVSLFSALTLAFGGGGVAMASAVPDTPVNCDDEVSALSIDQNQDCPEDTVCPVNSFLQGKKCKVTICHRTNSVTNPYVEESVSIKAVDGNGKNDHTQHTGDVPTTEAEAQAMKDADTKWGDIIPPHPDNSLNWNAKGMAIYRNHCEFVTGGQGGGETPPPVTPPTTTTTTTNVTNVTNTPAPAPAPQVVVTPTGGVGAGSGGASQEMNPVSLVGLSGSVVALAAGAAWLNRRNLVRS